MARLTKEVKCDIVNAVMKGVPKKYPTEEDINAMAGSLAAQYLPPAVRYVWDTPELRGFIATRSTYLQAFAPGPTNVERGWYLSGLTVYYPVVFNAQGNTALSDVLSPAEFETLDAEVLKFALHREERDQMKSRISVLVGGYSSDTKLIAAVPEWAELVASCMPVPEEPKKLPVDSLIADLSKLGWPKGEGDGQAATAVGL